jgi:hypothetical protein
MAMKVSGQKRSFSTRVSKCMGRRRVKEGLHYAAAMDLADFR